MSEQGERATLSVVTPVYNCAATILPLWNRIVATLERLGENDWFEVILVDDASSDDSWSQIERICAEDPRGKALRLTRNFGQHHALTAGLSIARGDCVVVLDADLQDPPEAIEQLLAAAEGFDIVDARRTGRTDPLWRRLGARFFHALFRRMSGLDYDERVANFRLIRRSVVDAYLGMPEAVRNVGAQLRWLGFSHTSIDVDQGSRPGRSSYSIAKLVGLALDTAIAYSNRPLRLAVASGLLTAAVSGVFTVWIGSRALIWGIPVEGWASLMASIWFLGGTMIATVGAVGIYVGRVYDETKGRPLYVVAERINC